MANLALENINKVYENGFHAVHDLSLDVEDGEFLVLVGPSGCGKSTALRMVAGLESISSGTLSINDRVVNDVHPKDRDIAMVFQNYALYPHMTVAENIGFALKLKRTPKAEIEERVNEAARMLELEEWLHRKPGQLSGGQRQRVAMGRAIVRRPAVFLMDEPLSNLDAKLRVQMRADVAKLQRNLGVTTMYVTHDQVEAMTMGDRVAVMRKGILQQVAPPQVLYDTPGNLFVAAFIGSPAMNLFTADVVEEGGSMFVDGASGRIRLSEADGGGAPRAQGPRRALDRGRDPAREPPRSGRTRRPSGGSAAVGHGRAVRGARLRSRGPLLRARYEGGRGGRPGGDDRRDHVALAGSGSVPVVARFGPRSKIALGEVVPIAVDTERMHFFDMSTRNAIWT